MASCHYILPCLIFLYATFLLSPSYSSALDNQLPLRLDLQRRIQHININAGLQQQQEGQAAAILPNYTRLEQFQHAVESSFARAAALMRRSNGGFGGRTSSRELRQAGAGYIWPVRSGAGDYVTDIKLGNPAKKEQVLVDTGSDLVWIQCKPCARCFEQGGEIFDPENSASFSTEACSGKMCRQLPMHACDRQASCLYEYQYGDGSTTVGGLSSERLLLKDGRKEVSVDGFTFGCGFDNVASFAKTEGPSGILGLGRGTLSLPLQLASKIPARFSYCLLPFSSPSSSSSPLFLGYQHSPPLTRFTPILTHGPSLTYYYVNLQGISINNKLLPIPTSVFQFTSSGGGSIFDSGTTLTLLPPTAYDHLKNAILAAIPSRPMDNPPSGLDLCYDAAQLASFPSMVFHFGGGADMSVPPENYMLQVDTDGTTCLVMMSAGEDLTIIGNLQQQNFHVFYDLVDSRIGFVPATCSKL